MKTSECHYTARRQPSMIHSGADMPTLISETVMRTVAELRVPISAGAATIEFHVHSTAMIESETDIDSLIARRYLLTGNSVRPSVCRIHGEMYHQTVSL